MSTNPHSVHTRQIPKSKVDYYFIYNPKYPIQVVFNLLGRRSEESLIIKGKPEDFKPNEVFKKVDQPFHFKTKGETNGN